MNKNITFSDLNVEVDKRANSLKSHLVAKVGIGIIEFLLASVLYCYGIIFSEYVSNGSHDRKEGLWTSILFICCWSFTDPIARLISEYFEDRKTVFFRYIVGCSTGILFLAIMVPHTLTVYMTFGGILSNLISKQMRLFATDKIDMDPKIFEAHRQVARALSLFLMPHFVFLLVSNYETNQVKLIFAAIILHIIPAVLIIKTDDNWNGEVPTEMSRYQTIGRFAYQMKEMKTFSQEQDNKSDTESSSSSSEETPVFQLNPDLPSQQKTQFYSATINKQITELNHQSVGIQNCGTSVVSLPDSLEAPGTIPEAVNVQSYYLNVGVSILPGIPEENEEESEDIKLINSKRLSRISDKLEELNVQDHIRKDTVNEIFSINEIMHENKPDPINKIEYIPNFKEERNRISVLDELKSLNKARHCCHCSPYRKYIWTRRMRMFKDFLNDNFCRPLYYAAKSLYFYPALTTKVVSNLVSTLYITLAPFMAMQKSWKQHLFFSTENATFLLTYIAFAWCFFLVALPLVLRLNHVKIKILYGFGLVVSGTSLWVLSGKLTNDAITISSLLFGLGYGITNFTEKMVFKSSIGMRPYYLVRGPLEILSAVAVLVIYYLTYLYKLDLKSILLTAALSYYFNAFSWFCLPFVKYFGSVIKRVVFDERSQQEGFFH